MGRGHKSTSLGHMMYLAPRAFMLIEWVLLILLVVTGIHATRIDPLMNFLLRCFSDSTVSYDVPSMLYDLWYMDM